MCWCLWWLWPRPTCRPPPTCTSSTWQLPISSCVLVRKVVFENIARMKNKHRCTLYMQTTNDTCFCKNGFQQRHVETCRQPLTCLYPEQLLIPSLLTFTSNRKMAMLSNILMCLCVWCTSRVFQSLIFPPRPKHSGSFRRSRFLWCLITFSGWKFCAGLLRRQIGFDKTEWRQLKTQ